MAIEALEQKVSDNRYNELRLLDTIDVYAESTAVLYTGPMLGTPGLTPTNVGFNTTDHGFRPMPWEHQTVLEEYGSGRYGNRLPEERQTIIPDYGLGNFGSGLLKERQTILPHYGIGTFNAGLLSKDKYTHCIDLPGIGAQLHLHGPDSSDSTILTHSRFQDYDKFKVGPRLNSYESAMADLWADQIGFNNYMKK